MIVVSDIPSLCTLLKRLNLEAGIFLAEELREKALKTVGE
jgi:hypothetical protein